MLVVHLKEHIVECSVPLRVGVLVAGWPECLHKRECDLWGVNASLCFK